MSEALSVISLKRERPQRTFCKAIIDRTSFNLGYLSTRLPTEPENRSPQPVVARPLIEAGARVSLNTSTTESFVCQLYITIVRGGSGLQMM